ncbi:MAG: PAS domain S-box protein, partial [Deltaproteobacteria bacterium]
MRKNLLFLLGFALLTAVFLINISLPYGYSVWLIDVAVLLTMFALEPSKIITLAVLSTVYVIAGFLLPRPGEVPVFALFNRISGIITIWIVSGFLISRKRYERLLREEEEWLKTISDAAFEGIYIHDGIRLVDCNNAMYQMLGYKKGELTGKPWVEVITAGSYRLVKEHWDSGTSEPYEVTLIRKDGSQILAELRGKDMIFQGRRLRAGAARDITEARRKEDQLRRSEERLRFALEAGNEGTWDYDLITDKLVLGVRSRRIFGFSKDEEVPYRKLVDRIHPDDRERVDRAVNAAFDPSGDGEYNIEYRLLMPDGSIRWVYARGQGYFRTENGQRRAYRFIGINTDITQRKTIEQQLARERANLNAVFDAVNVGMLLLDSKGTVKRVNSIVTSWVGKDLFNCCGGTPGSVIGCANAGNDGKGCGMTAKCISCPIRKAFGEAFRTGRALHNLEAEASLVTGGKMSTVWFDISVDLVDLAGERHAIMALNNITDRKNTEEKLRGSEERLRLALDAAHAGSWEWDLRTDKNVWSEQMWRLYGLKPHCCEPSYDAWLNSIAGEDRRRVGDTVRKAATEGTELSVEWRVRDEGGERWLLSRGRAVRDENGTVTRYIGIVLDITEQKRAEDILRRDRDSLDRLVTDRSHRLLETQKELDRSRRLS